MSIKLLVHAWRTATNGSVLEPARRVHAWGVESREMSEWNRAPPLASRCPEPFETPEPRLADPVWSDTQPWFHG